MKKILLVLPCAAVFGIVFTGVFAPVPLFGQSASEKNGKDADKKEPDNAPIVKLQLFKNGFGFVTREIAPVGPLGPNAFSAVLSGRGNALPLFVQGETAGLRMQNRIRIKRNKNRIYKKADLDWIQPKESLKNESKDPSGKRKCMARHERENYNILEKWAGIPAQKR